MSLGSLFNVKNQKVGHWVSESVSDKVTYWAVRWQLKIITRPTEFEFLVCTKNANFVQFSNYIHDWVFMLNAWHLPRPQSSLFWHSVSVCNRHFANTQTLIDLSWVKQNLPSKKSGFVVLLFSVEKLFWRIIDFLNIDFLHHLCCSPPHQLPEFIQFVFLGG